MRVTSKGQVTIPQEMRERMNIHPGTEVNFVMEGNTLKVVPIRTGRARGRRIVEALRGKGTVRMTTAEIMALTRRP
jgi:AbrB family looped-hinge helix DNA binding protein